METTTDKKRLETATLNKDRNELQNTRHSRQAEESKPKMGIGEFMIFFLLAITADLLGGLDITGFGAILVRIIDIFVVLTLWLWRALKGNKNITNNYIYQLLGTFLLEVSPFGILPTWTTFVLYIYIKDRKTGRQFLAKKSKE